MSRTPAQLPSAVQAAWRRHPWATSIAVYIAQRQIGVFERP